MPLEPEGLELVQTKYKVILTVVVAAVLFAAGRFSAPTKVQIVTKTVTVEKDTTNTDSNTDKHQVVTRKEVDKPDGTKEITTVTTDDTQNKTDTTSVDDTTTQTDQTKTITRDVGKVNISALIGADITAITEPVYGVSVSKNFVGPITFGVFGMSNKVAGCSIGLSF